MRTVLVTGATGAIGSILTRHLLEDPGTRVCLLIRAQSDAHLHDRLQQLLRFLEIGASNVNVRSRLEAVAGDVTLPDLGLDAEMRTRLAGSVTHVVHSAGNVRLNRPIEEARRSAVESVRHVVAFVNACRERGQFRKAEFVSTVGVAGRTRGAVPERLLSEDRLFRNTYEAAKAEAERVLAEHIRDGLPATIHRPGMVVGHSETGQIVQFQVFYHLCEFLSGARTAGVIPDAGDTRLDIIPVDYVAKAIVRSSMAHETVGEVLHLCSGPAHAPRVRDLAIRVQDIFASHGRRVWPLRQVPPALVRTITSLATPLARGHLRGSLKSMPYFLAYLDEPQTFATERTEAFLRPSGLVVPPVESYLRTVLAYYLTREQRDERRRAS